MADNIRNRSLHIINNFLSSPPTPSAIDLHITRIKKTTNRFIKNHPDLVITRADKRNVTVVLNRADYIQKMKMLLNDSKTYVRVARDPIKRITNDLRSLLAR